MPDTVVDPKAGELSAADKAVAASAAAAAEQAAAADRAAAEKAATEKAATDKAAAEKAAAEAEAAKKAVPDKYDLKVPADAKDIDPAIVERTAATARELGLSNEAGQTLLDRTVKELTTSTTARAAAETKVRDDLVAAWQAPSKDNPTGGAEWVKRNAAWTADAKADPELGKTPEEFTVSVERGQQALAKFGPELKPLLEETGYGSHPAVLKLLARIGRAMAEPTSPLQGAAGRTAPPKSAAQAMYPNHYNEDGSARPA